MDFRLFLNAKNRIGAEDVIRLRREVFDDMIVSLAEADGIFALNDAAEETCPEWQTFFVEAMVDYCVNQAKPHGYVSATNAMWLMDRISKDGHVKSCTELELLVKIIERAHSVPENLAAFALKEVSTAVVEGNGVLLNNQKLRPGVIGQPEAKMIRRIMYAVGADGQIRISQAEVDVLFDLNDRTSEAENHPEWNDVFVKAVAAFLMMASGYASVSREVALRREEWLDEENKTDVAGFLSRSLSSVGELMRNGGWSEAFQDNTNIMNEAWRQRNREDELEAITAEPVTQSEAQWLSERIGRDGVLHENEKALLAYIKEEADHVDPALQPLLEKIA
ncbi:MAG: hypothetical protein QNJ29_14150 [Rhizobiaceae bacterium]|nr:hypothetical protein [Rhizobiaceae bacterium]